MSANDKTPRPSATHGWKGLGHSRHFVQFYDDDAVLLDSICGYVGGGLLGGCGCIVIATAQHLRGISERLSARGFDIESATGWGQLVTLDADEVLPQLMIDGQVSEARFNEIVGSVVASVEAERPCVLAYGELVALLCEQGRHDAAIQLERMWNALARRHGFRLFCAYPIRAFDGAIHPNAYSDVCLEHTAVIPAERY